MKTLGQKRAAFALEKIFSIASKINDKDEFKSFTAGIPSMLLMNGFGQTLSFMVAKGDQKHLDVFDMLKIWLTEETGLIKSSLDRRGFLLNIADTDQKNYLEAQNEALALLEWIKRFAAMEAGGNG